jgi:hypothetical protein
MNFSLRARRKISEMFLPLSDQLLRMEQTLGILTPMETAVVAD